MALPRTAALGGYRPPGPSPLSYPSNNLLNVSSSSSAASFSQTAGATRHSSSSLTPLGHSTGGSSARSHSSMLSATARQAILDSFGHVSEAEVRIMDEMVRRVPIGACDYPQLKESFNSLFDHDPSLVSPNAEAEASQRQYAELRLRILELTYKLRHVQRGVDWAGKWKSVRRVLGIESTSSEEEASLADEDDDEDEDSHGSSDTWAGHHSSNSSSDGFPTPRATGRAAARRSLPFPRRERLPVRSGAADTVIRQKVTESSDHTSTDDTTLSTTSDALSDFSLTTATTKRKRTRSPPPAQSQYEQNEPSTTTPRQQQQASFHRTATSFDTHTCLPATNAPTYAARGSPAAVEHFQQIIASHRAQREQAQKAQETQREAQDEQLADNFYDRLVARRALLRWRAEQERVQGLEEKLIWARETVTRTKAWEKWREAFRRSRKSGRFAERADRARILLTTFRRWNRASRNRAAMLQEEKKDALRTAYRAVVDKRTRRIVEGAWDRWSDQVLEKRATQFRTHHLVTGSFAIWKLSAARKIVMEQKEAAFIQALNTKTLRNVFGFWSVAADLKQRLDHTTLKIDQRIARQTVQTWSRETQLRSLQRAFEQLRLHRAGFQHWRAVLEQQRVLKRQEGFAIRRSDRRVKSNALVAWRNRLAQVRQTGEKADAFLEQKQTRLAKTGIKQWFLGSNLRRLERRKATETLATVTALWRVKVKDRRAWQQESTERLQQAWSRRKKKNLLQAWRDRLSVRESREAAADRVAKLKVMGQAFDGWKAAQKQRQQQRQADEIRSRAVRLSLQAYLVDWKRAADRRKRERLAVATMHHRTEQRLQKQALQQWLDKVIEVRGAYVQAGIEHDEKLLKGAWASWQERIAACRERESLADSFADVQTQGILQSAFSQWKSFAHAERYRREKLEALLRTKETEGLSSVMTTWYDKYRDVSLRSAEFSLFVRRRELTQRSCLDRWIGASRTLPATRFRNMWLKRKALERWRTQLPLAAMRSEAVRHDKEQLMRDAWKSWKAAVQHRRTFRAAARFGGASANRLRSYGNKLHHTAPRFCRSGSSSSPVAGGRATRIPATFPQLATDDSEDDWNEDESILATRQVISQERART